MGYWNGKPYSVPQAKTKIWFKRHGKVQGCSGQTGGEENKKRSEVITITVYHCHKRMSFILASICLQSDSCWLRMINGCLQATTSKLMFMN